MRPHRFAATVVIAGWLVSAGCGVVDDDSASETRLAANGAADHGTGGDVTHPATVAADQEAGGGAKPVPGAVVAFEVRPFIDDVDGPCPASAPEGSRWVPVPADGLNADDAGCAQLGPLVLDGTRVRSVAPFEVLPVVDAGHLPGDIALRVEVDEAAFADLVAASRGTVMAALVDGAPVPLGALADATLSGSFGLSGLTVAQADLLLALDPSNDVSAADLAPTDVGPPAALATLADERFRFGEGVAHGVGGGLVPGSQPTAMWWSEQRADTGWPEPGSRYEMVLLMGYAGGVDRTLAGLWGGRFTERSVDGQAVWGGTGPEGKPTLVVWSPRPDVTWQLLHYGASVDQLVDLVDDVVPIDEATWVAEGGAVGAQSLPDPSSAPPPGAGAPSQSAPTPPSPSTTRTGP